MSLKTHILFGPTDNHTPKKAAQFLIMDAISKARGYWSEDEEGLTEREIAAIDEQLKKQADRVAKLFGYDESWVS